MLMMIAQMFVAFKNDGRTHRAVDSALRAASLISPALKRGALRQIPVSAMLATISGENTAESSVSHPAVPASAALSISAVAAMSAADTTDAHAVRPIAPVGAASTMTTRKKSHERKDDHQ